MKAPSSTSILASRSILPPKCPIRVVSLSQLSILAGCVLLNVKELSDILFEKISKSIYKKLILRDKDNIEIVHFIGGG